MPYSLENFSDIVKTTLSKFQKDKWTDIVLPLQQYFALPQVLKKRRVTFEGGWSYTFTARVASNSPSRLKLINEVDTVTTADMFIQGSSYMRYRDTYMYLNEIEVDANDSPQKIVDLVQGRKADAMCSFAEGFETDFWGPGPSSTSDVRTPNSINYWLTTGVQGFNGLNPTGFTDCGGISTSTYDKWKNYTDTYVSVSISDFFRRLRLACYKTNFRPPVDIPSASGQSPGKGFSADDWMFATNYNVRGRSEELLASQNDDLGTDLAPYEDKAMVRKVPLTAVPYLDADTNDPCYGIYWPSWRVNVLQGNYMKQTTLKPHPNIHRGWVQFWDMVYNYTCVDRRVNFRFTK